MCADKINECKAFCLAAALAAPIDPLDRIVRLIQFRVIFSSFAARPPQDGSVDYIPSVRPLTSSG